MKKKNLLPYDDSSKKSIYYYALELKGSTLREKIGDIDILKNSRNKGSFGNLVELHYFKIKNNNRSAPDFEKVGLELKVAPLIKRSGIIVPKERLVIGMINYMTVVNEDFETSHFADKAKEILLISYLWERDINPLDYRIEAVNIVTLDEFSKNDFAQIKTDWEIVVNKIHEGKAHEISSSDTQYIEWTDPLKLVQL